MKIVSWVKEQLVEEADTACFVGKTMVFFTRAAQRVLIQLKRNALARLRPAAQVLQAHVRNKGPFQRFEDNIKKLESIKALVHRFQTVKKLERVKRLKQT